MSKTSVVWDFFTSTGDKVKCGICRTTMKYNRASTSNMMRHMRLKHSTVNLFKRRAIIDNLDPDDPDASEQISNSNLVSIHIFFN